MNTIAHLAGWSYAVRTRLAGPGAPWLTAVGLATVLGWQIAGIFWQITPEAEPARPAPVVIAEPDMIDAGSEPGGSTRRLARLHLFGEMPPDEGNAGAEGDSAGLPVDAPETQLDLDLRGLYAIGDGQGFAIIVAGREGEQVFGVGDALPGNAEVAGVYGDRVLLRRDGNYEALWLDDAETRESQPATGQARVREDTQQIATAARGLRERLLENPTELARMVRFQPYQQDGDLIGFRLRPRGGHEETLRELGLTPQDVLTEVNGIPLNDPRRGQEALDELRDATEVNVIFLRDGQQQQVTLSLDAPG
jgi:general secretion pathway protein C